MAVYGREEFMKTIGSLVGEDNSDENLAIIENMSDTFDSLSNSSKSSKTDEEWEQEIASARSEVENEWKGKFRERFMSGDSNTGNDTDDTDDSNNVDDRPLTFENLFGGKE